MSKERQISKGDVCPLIRKASGVIGQRSYCYFMTNLLGTHCDGRIMDNGLANNKTWDGV